MRFVEQTLTDGMQGVLLKPETPSAVGVVVLGGSSGSVDAARASVFARRGATAIGLKWFGGEGQSPGVCEIPIESFTPATDRLIAEGCDRIAYVGTSKGAEAALLVGVHDPRIDVVVALSPSSVVWANVGPGPDGYEWPQRSSFSWGGVGLSFVPHEAEALLSLSRFPPVRYLELFQNSLKRFGDRVAAAEIAVERIRGEVILVAGGDDALWPSAWFARRLAERMAAHGRAATLVVDEAAGHRVLLPGETTPRSAYNAHGGTGDADMALGALAWREIAKALDLAEPPDPAS